jgi:hypothetical protein
MDTTGISIRRHFTPMPAAVKVIEDGHRWGRRGTEAHHRAVADRMGAVAVIANRRMFWPHGLRDLDQLNINRE